MRNATPGVAFLIHVPAASRPVSLHLSTRKRFSLEASEFKSIGGIAISISRMTEIDIGVIRVMLLLLNIFTLGIVGAIYFLVVWTMRRRLVIQEEGAESAAASNMSMSYKSDAVMAAIFILLAIVRVSTEFRWFFFNEPFVRGLLLAIGGTVLARRAEPLAVIAGAALLFLGIHDISIALFHVQPTAANRWVINYSIIALSVAYYAIVALRDAGRLMGFALACVPLIAAALIIIEFVSEPFLLSLGRFYDFFSPLLFSALALWVAMES
jgi:hypothetical protein